MKMVMIQDGPMPTGADKPLRISGDPYKVQVSPFSHVDGSLGSFFPFFFFSFTFIICRTP